MKYALYDTLYRSELYSTIQLLPDGRVIFQPYDGNWRVSPEYCLKAPKAVARGCPRGWSKMKYWENISLLHAKRAFRIPDETDLYDVWPGYDNDPDGTWLQNHPNAPYPQDRRVS